MTKIRSIITLLLTVVTFNIAMAQQGQVPADERASNQTRKMTKELNLQGDQITKVHEANLSFITAKDELKKRKASEAELDAEKKKYMEKLQTILTPEQYKRVEARVREKEAQKQK